MSILFIILFNLLFYTCIVHCVSAFQNSGALFTLWWKWYTVTAMKTLLFSIMIGDNPTYPYVAENLTAYATRIGADVVLCKELDFAKEFEGIYGCYGLERLKIADYLRTGYDRVVCVDSDVLIQPDAANIFDACPDEDAIYAFNEGWCKIDAGWLRTRCALWTTPHLIGHIKGKNGNTIM